MTVGVLDSSGGVMSIFIVFFGKNALYMGTAHHRRTEHRSNNILVSAMPTADIGMHVGVVLG
jgi:hypothetical protein